MSAASAEPGGWRSSEDELAVQMRAIAQQLGAAGLEADRQEFRGFLTTGARTTHKFNLPARGCATLIAIASRGVHDMDAALYSPEGDVLAVDTQPDAHPTMQVCNGDEARTIYYALQVYEGAGSFVIGMFMGEQATLERAAKVLGARPTIARLGHGEARRLGPRHRVQRRAAAPRLRAGAGADAGAARERSGHARRAAGQARAVLHRRRLRARRTARRGPARARTTRATRSRATSRAKKTRARSSAPTAAPSTPRCSTACRARARRCCCCTRRRPRRSAARAGSGSASARSRTPRTSRSTTRSRR